VEQCANVLRIEMAAHGVDVGSAHMTWIDTDLRRVAQQDLPGFRRTSSRLPGAFGEVTSLERSVSAASAQRQLLNNFAFMMRLMRATTASMRSEADAEMQAAGRSFGKNGVGMGEGSICAARNGRAVVLPPSPPPHSRSSPQRAGVAADPWVPTCSHTAPRRVERPQLGARHIGAARQPMLERRQSRHLVDGRCRTYRAQVGGDLLGAHLQRRHFRLPPRSHSSGRGT